MTTCMFKCNNEAENKELSNRIWESIKDWEEYAKKQVILCMAKSKEGEFSVYFSIEDRVKASVSVCFEASENTGKYYELVLVKNEERRVSVPADVKATIAYDRMDYEDGEAE